MAIFTNGVVPWNSLDDNTRLPLSSELESGYPCGEADQSLFNFTAGYAWGQVHNVILAAGITVDRANLLQLRDAIAVVGRDSALIAALSNPIFPEVSASGNIFTFSTSTGQIIVNTGILWQHRGLIAFDSTDLSAGERTFATVASKTYHLVWDAPGTGLATPSSTYPNGRFSLIDRTSASPVETDPSYDTTYDRMLMARVVTSGGNALTVTPLMNRSVLSGGARLSVTPLAAAGNSYEGTYNVSFGWARTPKFSYNAFVYAPTVGGSGGVEGGANYNTIYTLTRYGANINVFTDWASTTSITSVASSLVYNATA